MLKSICMGLWGTFSRVPLKQFQCVRLVSFILVLDHRDHLRPPLGVCQAYHHPNQRSCFIAISIYIKPSQTHGSVVGWSPLHVSMGDENHSYHFGAISYSICNTVKYLLPLRRTKKVVLKTTRLSSNLAE